MAKLINFPQKSLDNLSARVIYLKSYVESQIVDLTRARDELSKIQKRLKQLKNKANLKLIR